MLAALNGAPNEDSCPLVTACSMPSTGASVYMSSDFTIPEPLVCFLWTWGHPGLEYKYSEMPPGQCSYTFYWATPHLTVDAGNGASFSSTRDRAAQVSTHSRWCRSWHPRKKYRQGEEGRGPGSIRQWKQSWGLLRRCHCSMHVQVRKPPSLGVHQETQGISALFANMFC